MRVALVHDWLTGMRGGEKVLDALCDVFPGRRPVHAGPRARAARPPAIERRRISRSPVQWLPAAATRWRQYLPLFPFADRAVRPRRLRPRRQHQPLCGQVGGRARAGPGISATASRPCATPGTSSTPISGRSGSAPRRSAALRPILARLARWDRDTAHRVHRYLAISQYVARRIGLYYNRQSTIVYPPVDTEFFTPGRGARPPPLSDRVRSGALQTRGLRDDCRPPAPEWR